MSLKFDEKEIGENIQSYRQQWGWSKKELAERAGVAVAMVDHYERGLGTMNFYAIIHIANALNIHPDWLLAWKPEDEE